MEPYIVFGGTSGSYGHAQLTYNRLTGKYVGSFDLNTTWGSITNGQDSFFSGDIIGRSSTGDAYNIVDNLVLLNSELLLSKESISILSCTAAEDSWVIATSNQYTPFQVIATPAYDPAVVNALNKISPAFTGTSLIASDPAWPVTSPWRITMSSYYQNNAAFLGFKAFDRVDTTYWASGELTYSAAGAGNQWIQMEYPDPIKMAHVAYKYWRIVITLVRTAGASIHTSFYEVVFNSGWSIGLPSLLTAQPLIMGNAYGEIVNFVDTPVDWQFNLMILKNSRIINSGLYNLSLANGITKLS
ncbi:hypothetical protein T492DRAFT_848366 [Pavlovales sp. CCMP2436]|nr:hypothetical protein T492DRAFT_848366 [Pavlovales sp. CCMP2436]